MPPATQFVAAGKQGADARLRFAHGSYGALVSRVDRLLPWLAGAITLVVALLAIDPLPVGVFYDDAQYLILAKSLAGGEGYRFLNLPGAPLATHFPPGYPALLAILWKLSPSFPENVALFKFANAILLAIVAVLGYRLARRPMGVPSPMAFVATLAGTATIPSLVLSSSIMSEPLFLALLIPVLVWAERSTAERPPDETGAHELRTAMLLGAGVGCLALVRTHGIVLAPAIAACYVRHGRRRAAWSSAAASLLVVAPWLIWVQLHDAALPELVRGAYGSYSGWLATGFRVEGPRLLGATALDNMATIWWTIGRCLVPAGQPFLELIAAVAFVGLTVAGIGTLWRCARVTLLFVALYLVVVIIWPFSPLRFVWGIWPLLMLVPAAGAQALWRTGGDPRTRLALRTVAVAASAVIAAGTVWFNARGYANAWWAANARFHARRVLPQLAWVARASRPADVIASDAEGAVYLYTGRRAVPITSFTAAEYVHDRTANDQIAIVRGLVDRYQPSFVVVTSPRLIEAASRIAAAQPTVLVRIDSIARGEVYAHPPRGGR